MNTDEWLIVATGLLALGCALALATIAFWGQR